MINSFLSIFPAAINHVLAQEAWARAKLAGHAGKVARLDAGLAALTWQVAPTGMLQSVAPDQAPDVVIRVKLADLPLIAQDPQRAAAYAKVEGDADFANTISQLAQNLKWDAEEDLSKLVGDIAASRIVSGARQATATLRTTQQALAENVAEYFLEEDPLLMRQAPIDDFAREVVKLRDDLERLEKRVRKLPG